MNKIITAHFRNTTDAFVFALMALLSWCLYGFVMVEMSRKRILPALKAEEEDRKRASLG